MRAYWVRLLAGFGGGFGLALDGWGMDWERLGTAGSREGLMDIGERLAGSV